MNKVKVILVDDHLVVRAGFRMLLLGHPNIEVVAEADRGEALYQLYMENQPDVVVMDLSMPGIGGLETIRRMYSRFPNVRILVFSVHDEAVYVSRALAAGAKGYLTKNGAPEILAEAVVQISAGKTYIEPKLQQFQSNQADLPNSHGNVLNKLSPKEFDIFCLLAKGLTTQNIAKTLCLSPKTVANYGTQVRKKFNVLTVAELAHIANVLDILKK